MLPLRCTKTRSTRQLPSRELSIDRLYSLALPSRLDQVIDFHHSQGGRSILATRWHAPRVFFGEFARLQKMATTTVSVVNASNTSNCLRIRCRITSPATLPSRRQFSFCTSPRRFADSY